MKSTEQPPSPITMKAFGYEKRGGSSPRLMEMEEVSFASSSASIREIARFLNKAADEMDEQGANFGHMHLQDEWAEWTENWPDVIVVGGAE
jgi:hypothetical protein